MITFQLNKRGGSFIICPLKGAEMSYEEQILPNKVADHYMNQRVQFGKKSEEEDGIWFNFEDAKTDEDFEQAEFRVLDLLKIKNSLWIASLFDK